MVLLEPYQQNHIFHLFWTSILNSRLNTHLRGLRIGSLKNSIIFETFLSKFFFIASRLRTLIMDLRKSI